MSSLGISAREKPTPASNVIAIATVKKLVVFPKLMTTKQRANSKLPRKAIPLKQEK